MLESGDGDVQVVGGGPPPPDGPVILQGLLGALAQLGEHLLCKQGVTGSIPVRSTSDTETPPALGDWRGSGFL